MEDPKATLVRFCESHSPHHHDAAFLLGTVEEFFARASLQEYRLRSADEMPQAFVRGAVGRLTGTVPQRITTFTRASLQNVRSRNGELVQKEEGRSVDDHSFTRGGETVLESETVTLLKTALWDRFLAPLEKRMGKDAYHAFSETFMCSLGEPLWHSFEGPYWKGVGYDLMLGVRSLVLMTILAMMGELIWGEKEDVCALHPLVSILTGCIPYGLSEDGTLLVVVA